MGSPQCEQRTTKVSLAEILRCFEHPISEEQAWALCFQCCRQMEQLARGTPLHSVFIKGPGSIFIHADGAASFKVYHKSDVGSMQQSEDKLLEYLGVVIYEALDWGIDSQAERELSRPLEKLLCLMLKLEDEAMKPAATLQDVIKACEEHLSRPSEATSHYEITCRSLFTEYMELQKLVTIIQTSKESLRKMDVEDLVENPHQKEEKLWVSLWSKVIRELQQGVRLRRAAEHPRPQVPPRERVPSPHQLLLDDIQHKRYTLHKVIIKQNHRAPKVDAAAPKPHPKPVLEKKLEECVPQEPSWHKQLMAEIRQPQKLQPPAARANGRRPEEILVTPNTAWKSPSHCFVTPQDVSAEFKTVNTTTQHLGSGVQETTPKLLSSTWLTSNRSSAVSCNSTGSATNCPPMSAPTLGEVKPHGFSSAGQQQPSPCRGRSRSVERGPQSKELDCPFPTKWASPTIAELIGTRYTMVVLEGQSLFQGGVFPRAKICFSCCKQMFLKWPYSCYLCSSSSWEAFLHPTDASNLPSSLFLKKWKKEYDKMSMPFRMCVHLPLHFLKLLRLSREEDPATQEQKSSELLHEIEHWEYFGVPILLEPHCLAQPLCCYPGSMADWLTADICVQCEQYLLNVASSQQQSNLLRRLSWP